MHARTWNGTVVIAITVEKGVAGALDGHRYDLILANIERNTLLDAMPVMAEALSPGGVLLLSGFVVADRSPVGERGHGERFIPR